MQPQACGKVKGGQVSPEANPRPTQRKGTLWWVIHQLTVYITSCCFDTTVLEGPSIARNSWIPGLMMASSNLSTPEVRTRKPLAFYMSFSALLIMCLICSLDTTALAIAIPVCFKPVVAINAYNVRSSPTSYRARRLRLSGLVYPSSLPWLLLSQYIQVYRMSLAGSSLFIFLSLYLSRDL